MIELLLSVMSYVVIEHVSKCHKPWQLVRCSIMNQYWISWINLINPIYWLYLIISIIWFDLNISSLWSELIKSYFLILFNYFDSTVIPFTSLWKVEKGALNHIPDNIIG